MEDEMLIWEHFKPRHTYLEYATGHGHCLLNRETELDPWRVVSRERFERGEYVLERSHSYSAAIKLNKDTMLVSNNFIENTKA